MLPLPLLKWEFLFVAVKRACLPARMELALSTGLSGQQLSRAHSPSAATTRMTYNQLHMTQI